MASTSWGTGGGGAVEQAWAGNSTLSDTRIVSGAVELDVARPAVTDETIALWRMNEAEWDGSADEVVDAGPNELHGQAIAGATTVAGWMDRAGDFDGSDHVKPPFSTAFNLGPTDSITMECWFKLDRLNANQTLIGTHLDGFRRQARIRVNSNNTFLGAVGGSDNSTTDGSGNAWRILINNWLPTGVTLQTGVWYHLAFCQWVEDGTNNHKAQMFLNGVGSSVTTLNSSVPLYCRVCEGEYHGQPYVGATNNNQSPIEYLDGQIDEAWVTRERTYSGNFSPVRFPASGTVVAGNNAAAGTLTRIEWSATESGDNEGDVSAVEVYSEGSWQAVGGASPTSPITGLSLPVVAGNLVRFTLTPKADTLQSETPKLTWATAIVPAPKPAFDTGLDAASAVAAAEFASWFAEDEANPTRLTDVSGNALHGTLTDLEPNYAATVSGGSPAGVNGTYLPAGAVWRNDTYEIAEDWMMPGEGNWVLYPIGGDQMMDAMYWGSGGATPWGATWGTITVAQGDMQEGPFFPTGLLFSGGGGGYVSVPNTGAAFDFGTGDFTIVAKIMATASLGVAAQLLTFDNTTDVNAKLAIGIDATRPWGGSANWALNIGWGGSTSYRFAFPSSTDVYEAGATNTFVIKADRDGLAKLYLNGSFISHVDISSASDVNFSGMSGLDVGVHSDSVGNSGWCWDGYIDCLIVVPGLLSDADAARISGDIYALAEGSEPTPVDISPGEGAAGGTGDAGLSATVDADIVAEGSAGGAGDAGLEQETQLEGVGTAGAIGSAALAQTVQGNIVYPTFRQALWEGTAGDVLSGDVRALLVAQSLYGFDVGHSMLSDIPVGARIATSPPLANKSLTAGVFDADDVRVAQLISGAPADLCVTYLDSGVAATSRLLSFARGVGYTPVGGAPEIRWSASGIWSLLVAGDDASVVYPLFVAELLAQTLGDLSEADFYAVLVDTASYTYSAGHNFLDDVPAGARVATSRVLGNVSMASGRLTADNARFDDFADEAQADALVVYIDGASDAARRLVGYCEGFTVTGVGLPSMLAWGADGVASLRTLAE